ncbi:MAG: class I SAM-dependent methyltransferase [Sulfurospirillum sp.]
MKCKICNSSIKIIKCYNNNKIYKFCLTCQAIILENNFVVSDALEKAQYENHNNSFESRGYVEMFEKFLDYFWQDLDNNATDAFDFGSGPGPVLAQILKNRALRVDIYDKFYQPNKSYINKKYDLITSTEVFEHLQNPLSTLKLLKKHLKKNGLIAIMTLFHDNNEDNFLNWWYRRDPTHILFYTPKTFEVLADMCGLRVIKCDNRRIVVLTSS